MSVGKIKKIDNTMIVVISDIHDNLDNLRKCLDWCRKNNVEELICCGDIAKSETLGLLAKDFQGDIHLVAGNAELYNENELDKYDNIKYYGRIGIININNKDIGICHEPELINEILKQKDCEIIFYGHTHKPWMSSKKGKEKFIILANPGTLGGIMTQATFATINGDKIELKLLDQI